MLKETLFPFIITTFLNEAKDLNVVTVVANVGGKGKDILKVWTDSTKKHLMLSTIDSPEELKRYEKEYDKMMSFLLEGGIFKKPYIYELLKELGIEVKEIKNISKANKDFYGSKHSYYTIQLEKAEQLDKNNLTAILNNFKNIWNKTNSELKIFNVF